MTPSVSTPPLVEGGQDQGASADADRATHEQSPQAVSAVPVGIPSAWHIRETAHLNGGKEWFGYEHQCIEEPRLRRMDKYLRKDRSVVSTWRVDGADCASPAEAMRKLAVPPIIGDDEMAILRVLSPDFMSKTDLDALDIDWRNRQYSLSQKGLIWWEGGKVRLTAQGIETAKPPRREAGLARKGESPVAEGHAPESLSHD